MLEQHNSILTVIDMQEKLIKASYESDIIAEKAKKITKAASILSIPTIITEQYPKGLGQTHEEIKRAVSNKAVYLEKTSFSAVREESFQSIIKQLPQKQIILCGIETHICVLQTAIELMQKGYEVYILKDCCSSRTQEEKDIGLELLKQYGIKIVSVEIVIFEWLKSSKHTNFKEIQSLIK